MSRLLYGNSDFFSLNPSGVPVVGQTLVTGTVIGMSGTGAPESKVAAAPGSTWLQTDSTTDVKGWIRWVKATGTGNTGWVAGPEADTGWRDISSLLVNSWTAAYLRIRRVGDLITVVGQTVKGGATLTTRIITVPSGFTLAPNALSAVLTWREDSLTGKTLATVATGTSLNTYGDVVASGITWSTSHSLGGSHTWRTADAWPASLPGSAV